MRSALQDAVIKRRVAPQVESGRDLGRDLGRAPYGLYGVKYIGPVSLAPFPFLELEGPKRPNLEPLDLGRAPFVLYEVEYIDLVSLSPFPGAVPWARGPARGPVNPKSLDLGRAPYGLYVNSVTCIDLVPHAPFFRHVQRWKHGGRMR